jgi:uncharacterized membrane protein
MTKKEFLKRLEKKLMILNDEERKDILDEYTSIINDKISDGKTEEESINDFGNIDVLVDEILKAYKINANYKEKDQDLENTINSVNGFIKKMAKSLSEFTIDTVEKVKKENKNLTIELTFEIVIKIFITLLLLTLLFNLLQLFGVFVSEVISFGILRPFVKLIWTLLTGVVFIFVALAISYSIASDSLKKEPIEINKDQKVKKIKIKEEIKEEKVVTDNTVSGIILTILKVFVVFWTLPLLFMLILSYIGFTISIYLLVKGVMAYGIFILAMSFIIFLHHMIDAIYTFIFKGKMLKMYPFLISFILFLIGTLLTFDFFLNLKTVSPQKYILEDDTLYVDSSYDNTKIHLQTTEYFLMLKEDGMEIDDNELMITIRSHQKFVDIVVNERTIEGSKHLYLYRTIDFKSLYSEFVDNLKKNEMHDMHNLTDYSVYIYANQETLDKLIVVHNY